MRRILTTLCTKILTCFSLLSADTDEYRSLVQGLALIKDTISQVNAKVSEYERAARLREIALRLEQKSQGRLKNGVLLRREDLIQGNRTLMHEGPLTWKSSGRQKGLGHFFVGVLTAAYVKSLLKPEMLQSTQMMWFSGK